MGDSPTTMYKTEQVQNTERNTREENGVVGAESAGHDTTTTTRKCTKVKSKQQQSQNTQTTMLMTMTAILTMMMMFGDVVRKLL